MKNKNYLSDQIRNNIPKRNIEEGRESVRMFVEMLKKRKINVIDEAILNRAYEEEDYVDEKMLGLLSIMQNNFFLKNWNLKNIEKHSRYAKVYFRIRSKNFVMQRIR